MQSVKSAISNKCQPCQCSGFKAWCLKFMGHHVMSTGICIGSSNKIQMFSYKHNGPCWRSCYLQLALSLSISLVWAALPVHTSYEYALTYSTLHELKDMSNDCLLKLFKTTLSQVGQFGQKIFLVRLARWGHWPSWPKQLSTKALHSFSWLTPLANSKRSVRIVGFVLPSDSFSSPNSCLHLASKQCIIIVPSLVKVHLVSKYLSTGELRGVTFTASVRNPKSPIGRLPESSEQCLHSCLVHGVSCFLQSKSG